MKIGFIDSGIGGFSVLKALLDMGFRADYLYIYDNKYHPYGAKTKEEITAITFMNVERLIRMGAELVVIACNTATSAAINELRRIFSIPIIGVEPAIKPAIKECTDIVVMATPYTLKGDKLTLAMNTYTEVNYYFPDCHELAYIIEHSLEHEYFIYNYLADLLSDYTTCDGLVLGCTHYNFVKKYIEKILPKIKIYDSDKGVAKRIIELARQMNSVESEYTYIEMIPTKKDDFSEKVYFLSKFLGFGIEITEI